MSDDEVFRAQVERHEPSAWFRDAVRKRLDVLASSDASLGGVLGILAFTLGEVDDEVADRSCDRCGVHVPVGDVFYTGLHQADSATLGGLWARRLAGSQVLVGYGLCAACTPREFGPLDQFGESP